MFSVLLLIMSRFGLFAEVVNVERAFLYGELEEEYYMECPLGTKDVGDGDYIILECMSTTWCKQQGSKSRRLNFF